MKFLVDAQLPRRLAHWLREAGYDALHTLDLSQGNHSSDSDINEYSVAEQRVLITKDSDFVHSFLVLHKPYKLLLVSTGNVKNTELEALFAQNIKQIVEAFALYDFIEIDRTTLVFHM
jgi:predicted nuclease of predicted toxin-antitoxin system